MKLNRKVIVLASVIVVILLSAIFVTYGKKYSLFTGESEGELVCINEEVGISITLPNASWTCLNAKETNRLIIKSPEKEAGFNKLPTSKFSLYFDKPYEMLPLISKTDAYCLKEEYSTSNELCQVSLFYSNDTIDIKAYTNRKYGETTSYFGTIDNVVSVTVTFNESNDNNFTAEEEAGLNYIINSITPL